MRNQTIGEKTMETEIKIDAARRLYTCPVAGGWSSFGFDYADRDNRAIREELNLPAPVAVVGTVEALQELRDAQEAARLSGRRLECGLHPKLRGLEGSRVEATLYGERVRFQVGKSTGWIPCHLQIHNSRSTGGGSIRPDADLGDVVVIRRGRA